jgi:hypothetical protein
VFHVLFHIIQSNDKLFYAFFWVIPRHLNFICRRFGTPCLFHLHRQMVWRNLHTYLHVKIEQTECSETSAYKIQTLGNYPEESIQHSQNSESLKSRVMTNCVHPRNRLCLCHGCYTNVMIAMSQAEISVRRWDLRSKVRTPQSSVVLFCFVSWHQCDVPLVLSIHLPSS